MKKKNKKKVAIPVDLSVLRQTLPAIIPRKKLEILLGGLISPNYMANLDAKDCGPEKIKFGRSVAYLRDDLVDWLESRASVEPGDDHE